jgi:hypothetical protein
MKTLAIIPKMYKEITPLCMITKFFSQSHIFQNSSTSLESRLGGAIVFQFI